jgi:abortive infection bacteriophage resistance protein
MRIVGGFFVAAMKFTKPAKTYCEQLTILKDRGLSVASDDEALRWLRRVNYYRMSAYFNVFKESPPSEAFIPDASFENVIDLYVFDCRLRSLFMVAMERIEVSLRTAIAYEMSHTFGTFSHTDPDTYSSWFLRPRRPGKPIPFDELMDNIHNEEKRAKELFVKAYRAKYTLESHLPVWMAVELISFGKLSMMFEGLRSATKTKIAGQYGLAERPFQSWMHTLASIRNTTAHHGRLWNRTLGVRPVLPRNWMCHVPATDRIYCVAVMIQHLLRTIGNGSRWKCRLSDLFSAHPGIPLNPMGFPVKWREMEPWK